MRTCEIGIRLALGGPRRSIVLMIARQGMRLTAVGCAVGLLLALALGRAVASLLFGVAPFDPTVFAAASATVPLLAAMACVAPSARAARTDPPTALRAE